MHSPAEWPRHARVYVVNVLILMCVVYPALLVGSVLVAPRVQPGVLRMTVAVIPAVPLLLTGLAAIRLIRQLDELQRRIHIEAMAAGFCAMLGVALTSSFLQFGGQRPLTAWVYVIAGAGVWLVAFFVQLARYR